MPIFDSFGLQQEEDDEYKSRDFVYRLLPITQHPPVKTYSFGVPNRLLESKQVQYSMPAIRRTCKQLYHEANLLPYSGTLESLGNDSVPYDAVFSFASGMVLTRFCNLYRQRMLRISLIWFD